MHDPLESFAERGVGVITLALGMYLTCKRIDLLISFGAATWLRILQYLPVGFLFVPLTMAGYVGVPKEKTNAAAGLMNFMRNIGQSVRTSAVTTCCETADESVEE